MVLVIADDFSVDDLELEGVDDEGIDAFIMQSMEENPVRSPDKSIGLKDDHLAQMASQMVLTDSE